MARLRFDNIFGTSTGNPITCPAGAGTATLSSAPGLPAITGPDFIVLIIEPGTANEDIRYATYSGSGTSLTVTAAQEGTTGISHAGVAWAHGPTAADFASGPSFPTSSGSGSPQGVVTDTFGASYVDTANGAIYFENNTSGFVSPPSDWLLNTATTTGIASGSPVPGGPIMDQSNQFLYVLSDTNGPFGEGGFGISDLAAIAGSFNGIYYSVQVSDGTQEIQMRTGTGGAFTWSFDHLGRTILPGLLVLDTLQLGNGVVTPPSGAYAMTGNELLVIHNNSVTLPDPVANGFNVYWIKDSGSGTLVLHQHGTEQIDGHASLTFAAYEAACVFSNFSTWLVISANAGAII